MSNWQELAVVLHALALAVLGGGLLWAVATAFVRLAERHHARRLPPAAPSGHVTSARRDASLAHPKPLTPGLSR